MHLNRSNGDCMVWRKMGVGFASFAFGRSEKTLMVMHSNGVYAA